ncbi:MAG: FtsQ-type POTRA domain-containing protein [Clostridia bacterium]|nr:FtsQ-type POTRA domain-containing protein [Clostridia bacterium]
MNLDERYEELELKDVDRKRRRHRKKHYILRVLAAAAVIAAAVLFLRSDYFAIKEIQVTGNSYYTDDEVRNMCKSELGRNILFDSGISETEERLIADPYFSSVEIKRKLPDKISITVEERHQQAAFIYGEDYVVIDDEGIMLRKTNVAPELTLLTGLTISRMDLGEKVEAEEKENLVTVLKMLRAMESGDIYFIKIDVSRIVIKAYIYDNFIVKGTPQEILSAIEKGQLQKVVASLFADGISRGTIKMGGESYMSFSPDIESD